MLELWVNGRQLTRNGKPVEVATVKEANEIVDEFNGWQTRLILEEQAELSVEFSPSYRKGKILGKILAPEELRNCGVF